MLSSPQAVDLFQRYVIGNYTRYPVCLVRGEGSSVWDDEGNRYLDMLGGFGMYNVGRNNPNKLYAADIAETIMAAFNMPRRALWPELAVFANNPWKED
jgi:acetylornithine/succinyldiaminopimelate/putrescine aminotransferase